MSFIRLSIAVLVSAVGFWGITAHLGGKTIPQRGEVDREMKVNLRNLKDELPNLVRKWEKSKSTRALQSSKVKFVLENWIGRNEVKLWIVSKCIYEVIQGCQPPDRTHFLTLHLRYYDGHWTTIGGQSSEQMDLTELMLQIDQISGKLSPARTIKETENE